MNFSHEKKNSYMNNLCENVEKQISANKKENAIQMYNKKNVFDLRIRNGAN